MTLTGIIRYVSLVIVTWYLEGQIFTKWRTRGCEKLATAVLCCYALVLLYFVSSARFDEFPSSLQWFNPPPPPPANPLKLFAAAQARRVWSSERIYDKKESIIEKPLRQSSVLYNYYNVSSCSRQNPDGVHQMLDLRTLWLEIAPSCKGHWRQRVKHRDRPCGYVAQVRCVLIEGRRLHLGQSASLTDEMKVSFSLTWIFVARAVTSAPTTYWGSSSWGLSPGCKYVSEIKYRTEWVDQCTDHYK